MVTGHAATRLQGRHCAACAPGRVHSAQGAPRDLPRTPQDLRAGTALSTLRASPRDLPWRHRHLDPRWVSLSLTWTHHGVIITGTHVVSSSPGYIYWY